MRASVKVWGAVFLTAFVWISFANGQDRSPEEEIEIKLWAAMAKCWATVEDLSDPSRLDVTVFVTLHENGTLMQEPVIVSPKDIDLNDEEMQVAVNRAVRAAKKCAPYDFPREHYEVWQNITMRFAHSEEPLATS